MPIHLGVTADRSVMEYEAAADASLAKESLGTLDSDLLAIWLLSKRAEDSDRTDQQEEDPYIASLPTRKELSHLPVYWDEADASCLMGSEVGVQLASRKRREAEFFGRLSKSSASFSRIAPTLDSWMWAKSNIQSRGFSISNPVLDNAAPGTCIGEEEEEKDEAEFNDGGEKDVISPKIPALFPLADMVNHVSLADGCTCEWGIERDTGDFLLRTIKEVKADSELSLSYGSISSIGSLLNYGFVYGSSEHETQEDCTEEFRIMDENQDDAECATIRLSLDIIEDHSDFSDKTEHDLRELKTEIWARDEGLYPGFDWKSMERVILIGVGTVESALTVLSLLRVGVATKEELFELMEDDQGEDGEERGSIAAMLARNPFRWRNEREALRVFENVIEAQLKGFYEMNCTMDATGGNGFTFNKMNALKAVQAEKQVLVHWWRIAKMAGSVLDKRRDCFDFGLQYAKLFRSLLGTRDLMPVEED